ncbi:MAG: hypothetical protein ACR2OJ_11635 [Hyphomicrobiales bacterium]
MVIYLGMVELGNAIAADRKVTLLSSTVGDIVAQYSEVTQNDMDRIFEAAQEVLRPYEVATDKLLIEVYSITTNETNDQVQSWPGRVTNGGSCGVESESAPAVPADLLVNSASVIVARVCYKYESVLNYLFKTDPQFDEVFYIRPRYVDAVEWKVGA